MLPIIMKQRYSMPSNNHSTFSLHSFMMQGYHKAIQSTHNHIEICFNKSTNFIIPIFLIKNYLDHVNISIILPSNKLHANMLCPEFHLVSLTSTSLNHVLTVHEKDLHSLFYLDHKLSRSGQAINIPVFPLLDIKCPK